MSSQLCTLQMLTLLQSVWWDSNPSSWAVKPASETILRIKSTKWTSRSKITYTILKLLSPATRTLEMVKQIKYISRSRSPKLSPGVELTRWKSIPMIPWHVWARWSKGLWQGPPSAPKLTTRRTTDRVVKETLACTVINQIECHRQKSITP